MIHAYFFSNRYDLKKKLGPEVDPKPKFVDLTKNKKT